MNETVLDLVLTSHFENVYRLLSKRFNARRINTYLASDSKQVRSFLGQLLTDDDRRIGFSDSVTLHQLGVYDYFDEAKKYEIMNPFERYQDGKLKIFGEQPSGKLDLPYDEYYAYID